MTLHVCKRLAKIVNTDYIVGDVVSALDSIVDTKSGNYLGAGPAE